MCYTTATCVLAAIHSQCILHLPGGSAPVAYMHSLNLMQSRGILHLVDTPRSTVSSVNNTGDKAHTAVVTLTGATITKAVLGPTAAARSVESINVAWSQAMAMFPRSDRAVPTEWASQQRELGASIGGSVNQITTVVVCQ